MFLVGERAYRISREHDTPAYRETLAQTLYP